MDSRLFAVAALALLSAWAADGPAEGPAATAQGGATYTVFASGLAGPRGLLFAPKGELYVAEQSGGTVARVEPDGRVTRVAKGFSSPHDLALDPEGNLYVADSDADRIARVSPRGEVTTYIDRVPAPVDLDFNPQGELLVCELYQGKVVAYRDGKLARVVASGLSWPHGLAFGKRGETYINENTGNRIDVVETDGKRRWFADVERPVGLVIAPSGNLFVAQPQVGKVSLVRPDGTRVTLLDGLKEPRDPAFDAVGNLYVAETGTGRVLKIVGVR